MPRASWPRRSRRRPDPRRTRTGRARRCRAASRPARACGRTSPTAGSGRAPAGQRSPATRQWAAHRAVTGEAALRGVDRIGQAGVEPEPAVALRERRPARDRARHRDRARPAPAQPATTASRLAGAGPAASSPCARPSRHTIAKQSPPTPVDIGSVTHVHRRGGDRGVGRVAAALERPQARARGERLAGRDHGFPRDGRRSPERRSHGASVIARDRGVAEPVSGHRVGTCPRRNIPPAPPLVSAGPAPLRARVPRTSSRPCWMRCASRCSAISTLRSMT